MRGDYEEEAEEMEGRIVKGQKICYTQLERLQKL